MTLPNQQTKLWWITSPAESMIMKIKQMNFLCHNLRKLSLTLSGAILIIWLRQRHLAEKLPVFHCPWWLLVNFLIYWIVSFNQGQLMTLRKKEKKKKINVSNCRGQNSWLVRPVHAWPNFNIWNEFLTTGGVKPHACMAQLFQYLKWVPYNWWAIEDS